MRTDPMHKTVCDRCWMGTWYETEQPCKRSRPVYCPTCHQSTGDEKPCGGTLRVIDRSSLAPQFTSFYDSGDRVRVRFTYGEELTGTVSKTTGWKPCYLLMRRSNDHGSPYTLSAGDQVIAVKRGRKYLSTVWP